MDQLPDIKLGNRVRVMQTDEMVERGLANKKGVVTAIAGNTASIQFDNEGLTTRQINFSSLMKME